VAWGARNGLRQSARASATYGGTGFLCKIAIDSHFEPSADVCNREIKGSLAERDGLRALAVRVIPKDGGAEAPSVAVKRVRARLKANPSESARALDIGLNHGGGTSAD
jgi:hypothetical protein